MGIIRWVKWGPDMPRGIGLRLTDEDAIYHYLPLKTIGELPEKDDVIAELDDVYEWDAWDLPAKSKIQSDDQMWWFFCRRDHIDGTSNRLNRRTKSGFWKITGRGRVIKDQETQKCIGKTKILVFHVGRGRGRTTNWVVHEYHSSLPNVVPNQRPYVLCRLEKKTNKVITRGCDEGELSASIISESNIDNPVIPGAISEVPDQAEVNPVAPGAISEVPGQVEENEDLYLTEEDIRLIFSGSCDENPEGENPFIHEQPNVTYPLENRTDEKAGTPDCDTGEPRIPEVHGHAEVDAESLLHSNPSPEFYLTEEDICWLLSDEGEKIKSSQHKPEPENPLPLQWPGVICNLKNKTDENAGTLSCDIGEPSGVKASDIENRVAPTAILEVHGRTEVNAESSSQPLLPLDCYLTGEDIASIFSTSFNCDQSPAEFSDGYGNYNSGETSSNLFNAFTQQTSLKRPYFPDALASSGADAVGADGRVKRPRLLAHGDPLHS